MTVSLYAGLLGLMFLALSIRVIGGRRLARVGLGDGGDLGLQRRMRAQANFAEYVPIVLLLLLLMLLAELQGVSAWILHGVGACLVFGRIAHAVSISRDPEPSGGRVVGMAFTFTALGLSSVACLAVALGLAG
jgi:uncharacterized protein